MKVLAVFVAVAAACLRFVVVRLETAEFPIMRDFKVQGPYTHIIVAGAWMLPDGSLSATFKRRVERAVALQKDHANSTVVFTGGLGEGPKALAYAQTLGGCGARPCRYENASTTTAENAHQAARLIRNKQAAVVVVSSPYHLGRCILYFTRFYQKVDGIGATGDAREKCNWDRKQVDFWVERTGLCVGEGPSQRCLHRPRFQPKWLHSCVLGVPYVAATREVLAWVHNIFTFRTNVHEARFSYLRYRGGRKRGRKDKPPAFMKNG